MPPFVANENLVTTLLILLFGAVGPGGEVGVVAGSDCGFEFETSWSVGWS